MFVSNDNILTIRVPKEMRKKMKQLDVDWASYLREAIEVKMKELKRRRAADSMDKIRSETKLGKFDATRSIREDRDT